MGCGTSMSDSQIMKQSTSPKKPPLIIQQQQQQKIIVTKNQPKLIVEDKPVEKKANEKQQTESIEEEIKDDAQKQKEQMIKSEENLMLSYQSIQPIKQGKVLMFGQSADERKIVSFDLHDLKFETVAARSRKVESNPKYQPSDVIFQQSQQLQASHLYNKYSHPPYNFMFATYLNDEKIFLCGGINADFQYISDQAFLYRVNNNLMNSKVSINGAERLSNAKTNLLGLKFEKLEYMNRKRYSHMGVFFPMGKLSYVYVFGGMGQDQQTMTHCEKYSFYQKKWTEIAPLTIPRSTGFSLIFKSKIYVFGGYTSEKKRTKKIQVYDPIKNYWQILDVKLHRGIQAGIIFSVKPNEILIMGGNMQLGTLKSVIKINLAQRTYQWDSNMKNDRFLQKGGKLNDQIFIFGGDFQDTFERYSLKDRKWRDQQISYKDFIAPSDINSFTLATQTIDVKFDESLIAKPEPVSEFERIHIFGNDQFPCILQINLSKWVLRRKPVPMSLRLRCHMTVIKIKEGKYLIAGGVDSFGEKCSKAAFLYYAGTNKAIEVGKMNQKKYQMAKCVYEGNTYIFGGRSSFQGQILASCEKFDLQEQKWKPLKNLSRERTNAKTLIHKDLILIWGGCDSLQNLSEIEVFNPKTQEFSIYEKSLPISSQIRGVIYSPQKQSKQIIIFSYNDLLNQEYCHSCNLEQQQKDTQPHDKKLQQSALICSNEIKLNEIKVKLSSFNSIFTFGQNAHLITSKGIQTWSYKKDQQIHAFKPQIIINQVEMLQFPVEKFSFP